MTTLSGKKMVWQGRSCLFNPLWKFITLNDLIGIAIIAVGTGRIPTKPEGHAIIHTAQFALDVKLPANTPTLGLLKGRTPQGLEIEFAPKDRIDPSPNLGGWSASVPKYIMLNVINMVFIEFYEKNRPWLRQTFGGDTNAWPMIFNFARIIRNFMAHHAGKVGFPSEASPPVSWHHLTYSPQDKDKLVIGNELIVGDLLVLLYEVGAELDRLGCPPA